MRLWMRTVLMVAVVGGALAFFAVPAQAQRTGDHIVPAIETVCDGDPFSFGLCNAYCEALDCESATPLGTPRACSNLLRNYKKKSGGLIPPCGCPCDFNLQPALAALLEEDANYDVENGVADCGPGLGPNGEEAFTFTSGIPVEEPDPVLETGVVYFWVTDGQEPECHELGELFDEGFPAGEFWGPNGQIDIPLEGNELQACQAILDFLCAD